MDQHRPSASWQTLKRRARLLAATRQYFDQRGFIEVDTPLLSADRVIDSHLVPFAVFNAERPVDLDRPLFLQTSPEFAMKRLLAAGAGPIYQLGKVFRADETGQRHNPEFTMLEWYEPGATDDDVMRTTEQLLYHLVGTVDRETLTGDSGKHTETRLEANAFERRTYTDLFRQALQLDPLLATTDELVQIARQRLGKLVPDSQTQMDRDGWLNLLLAICIEPDLGHPAPVFVTDYPATQAALARLRPRADGVLVAGRFELYWQGVELCNGYHELTDASELRRRISDENDRRTAAGQPRLPLTNQLLSAMDEGLPPCAGNAVGFDRVVMLLLGAQRIDEVIPFPTHRA